MKVSILTSLLAATTLNNLAAADEHRNLRGDSNRDLGLIDDIVNSFTGSGGDSEGDAPVPELINVDGDSEGDAPIPELIDAVGISEVDLETFDLGSLPALLENLESLKGLLDIDLEQIKEIMGSLDQIQALMPILMPFLGNNNEALALSAITSLIEGLMPAESACTTPCDCANVPDFLSPFTADTKECILIQYGKPKPGTTDEFQQRCVPEMIAAIGVGSQLYTCAPNPNP